MVWESVCPKTSQLVTLEFPHSDKHERIPLHLPEVPVPSRCCRCRAALSQLTHGAAGGYSKANLITEH